MGVSATSIGIEVENSENKIATLASKSGAELNLGKLYFCPKSNREIIPFLKIQNYTFDDSENIFDYSSIDPYLLSTGFQLSETLDKKNDFIGGVGLKQNFSFSEDNSNERIKVSKIVNFQVDGLSLIHI